MSASSENRLHEIIAAYLERADESPETREALVRQHPDLVLELEGFFADHDAVRQVVPPVTAPGQPGLVLAYTGDYELLEELGRGGMGIVYKARQRSLGRVVAVKVIAPGSLVGNEVKRFRKEAEAVAALDHAGIVPIYEVGEWRREGQDPVQYFSMKYMDGGSVEENLSRFHDDLKAGARLLHAVALAVDHAHQRGVLHRDLKPANILLGADGRACVTDFGLAKRLGGPNSSTNDAIVGTAGYMSPEQAAGSNRPLTVTSDVYSLGAILYTLVTGQPPFQGVTPLDTLMLVLEREPIPLRKLRPGLPRDLETIILCCLHKNPQRRYRSAEALADDLQAWLDGRTIAARPEEVLERTWRIGRRYVLPVAAIGLLLLVLVRVSGYLAGNRQPAPAVSQFAEQPPPQPAVDPELLRREQEARQERTRLRALGYSQDMPAVAEAWSAGDVPGVRRLLAKYEPPAGEDDVRRWEWIYHDAASRGYVGTVPLGRDCYARSISPDGRAIVNVHRDNANCYDLKTGKLRWSLRSDDLGRVNWSPDGAHVAVVPGALGVGHVLNATTGAPVLKWNVRTYSLDAIAWHPSGQRFVVPRKEGGLTVHDLSGKELARVPWNGSSVAWSPDGKKLASAGSVFDADSGKTLVSVPATGGAAWNPASDRVVFNAAIYDLAGNKLLGLANAPTEEFQPRWSSDGKRIFTNKPNEYGDRVAWNADTGAHVEWSKRGSHTWALDGQTLMTTNGTDVSLWDPTTLRERVLAGGGEVPAINATGSRMALGTGVWDLRGIGPPVRRCPWPEPGGYFLAGVEWAPDSKVVRSRWTRNGDETDTGWNFDTDQKAPGKYVTPSYQHSAWDATGDRLACVSDKNGLEIWDTATGRPLSFRPFAAAFNTAHQAYIWWPPDKSRVVTTSERGVLKIWDLRSDREPLSIANVYRPAFSADGKLLAAGPNYDGKVRIWEVQTGREVQVLDIPKQHAESHSGVDLAFSPDARRLAVRNPHTGVITIWDREQKALSKTLAPPKAQGSEGYYDAPVAWSPSGEFIVSWCNRGIRLWNVKTGESRSLSGRPGTWIRWSPDSKLIAHDEIFQDLVSGEKQPARAVVRDAATGREQSSLEGMFTSVVWQKDGPKLAAILQPKPTEYQGPYPPPVARVGDRQVALGERPAPKPQGIPSPNGKYIVVHEHGDGSLRIREVGSNREVGKVPFVTWKDSFSFYPAKWSGDGKRLAVLSAQPGKLTIWSEGGETVTASVAEANSDFLRVLLWTAGDRRIITSYLRTYDDAPTAIECWDTVTGRQVFSFKKPASATRSMVPSPDGRWLAVAGYKESFVIDAEVGTEKVAYGPAVGVSWSPDSKRLVLWNDDAVVHGLETPKPLALLGKTRGPLVWSPDGAKIAGPGAVWFGKEK